MRPGKAADKKEAWKKGRNASALRAHVLHANKAFRCSDHHAIPHNYTAFVRLYCIALDYNAMPCNTSTIEVFLLVYAYFVKLFLLFFANYRVSLAHVQPLEGKYHWKMVIVFVFVLLFFVFNQQRLYEYIPKETLALTSLLRNISLDLTSGQ